MTFFNCPRINLLKNKEIKTGFTLIELLVVVTIISIITGIGIASYTSFNEKQALDKTAEELKTQLRLVQAKAVNNEKETSCSLCQTEALYAWIVRFDENRYFCSCGDTDPENCTDFGGSYKTLVNLDYNSDGTDDFYLLSNQNPARIRFYSLGGTSLTTDMDISVYSSSGIGSTVRIYPAGDIIKF